MSAQGEFFERPGTIILDSADESAAPLQLTPMPAVEPANATEPDRRAMKDLSIPKLYYSISEVSRLTSLEPYVLRYWETEFDDLRPQKNRAGNRIYTNKDIKLILHIKELLREQRYTIEGAKAIFKSERLAEAETPEEIARPLDPAQIAIPTENPLVPQATLTLEELQTMKLALLELRSIFK